MWLSGERVMLLCRYCDTRNTFPNGKCINCGASAKAPKMTRDLPRDDAGKFMSYFASSSPYFVSGGVTMRNRAPVEWG